jgi:hypothetical protein
MSALSIQPTYPIFTDIDGQPLEDGFIWIGQVNLDPQVNPINVFWDAALTIPTGQPIRTLAGYPSNSGTPARLYVNSDYSIRVMNKNGSVVYSAPAATERYGNIITLADLTFQQAGIGAVQRTALSKMREFISVKDFGAVGDGVTDDSAAIQAAIDSAGPNITIVYPEGTYFIGSTVNLEPQQHHMGLNAIIKVNSNTVAFQRTTDGFPGRIKFSDLRFEGTLLTGKAIRIVNNTPFVQLENCYFEDFAYAVELSGSYCSNFNSCYFSYNTYGLLLRNECHSSQLINCFFDGNTYAGLAINGTPTDGNLGANVHNITSIGCAYQNSEFGVWVESAYEFAAYNTYHEGNTKCDMRLGVGDAGTYARFCYNFTIDSWQTSSPCAAGKNMIMEHAVRGNLRGLAFNAGTSTTGTVLEIDGFSDLINIDYHYVSTSVPYTTTVPFNYSLIPNRVIVAHNGRPYYPFGATRLQIGSLDYAPGSLLGNYPAAQGFRPTVQLQGYGTNVDVSINATDRILFKTPADAIKFNIDFLNTAIVAGYEILPDADNVHSLGFTGYRWSEVYAANGTINTSDEREKDLIEAIPQSWLDAWGEVQYNRYKFKDAIAKKGQDSARWHVGLVAQRVKEAFERHGVDAFAIGLLCYDEWDDKFIDGYEETEVTNEDGSVSKKYTPVPNAIQVTKAGNRYGIRYEQALALECAYLRSKLGA